MTKDASFKKVVRRHAEHTGQRYTEALTDLEGLEARMFHKPEGARLVAHLRDRYGIDAVSATQVSQHRADVFRIDRTTATRGSRGRHAPRLARQSWESSSATARSTSFLVHGRLFQSSSVTRLELARSSAKICV